MKKAGVLLIVLGIVSVFLAFNMDVVVGTSYNIGLLNERQNIVYLSGILFLAGIMLFGFGVVAKEESKSLKMFTLWAVLTPIVLLLTIKIVSDIQAERAKKIALQVEQAEQAALEARYAEQIAKEKRAKLEILQKNTDKFVDNKNGTVTFKVTGLTWQRCSVGQIWTGETCSGEAIQMIWADAMKLSSSFAGHNDWRLPTADELKTLIFCSDGKYDNRGSCDYYSTVDQPTINPSYFPNTPKPKYDILGYWSSSPDNRGNSPDNKLNSGFVWSVDFKYGITFPYYAANPQITAFVFLVR